MAIYITFPLSLLLITLATTTTTTAIEYMAVNYAGYSNGSFRYTKEIGLTYSLQTILSSTEFIGTIFQQPTYADKKNIQNVTLIIENSNGVAFTSNNEIHFNANYLGNYSGDVKTEFTGVVYHEMTHVWQWNGNGHAPGGLIEGVADYVRLKANLGPSHWVQPGDGTKWDQGYDVTARFLDYCNGLKNGFVAELNKKMISGYSDNFFVDILGKNVDQLWRDYKAKYGKSV